MKVLIATTIGEAKRYCTPFLVKQLSSKFNDVPHDHLIVADNADFSQLAVQATYIQLPEYNRPDNHLFSGRIARLREACRAYFAEKMDDMGYTHLYFHDADMLPPANIISALMGYKAPIATGIYPIRSLDYAAIPAYHGEDSGQSFTSTLLGTDGDQMTALAFGMGCMLIEAELAKSVPFRPDSWWTPANRLGEDYQWCLDTHQPAIVNLTQSCWHATDGDLASKLQVGPSATGVVWVENGIATNRYGYWHPMAPRYDLTEDQADQLGAGFVRFEGRSLTLLTQKTSELEN